MNGKKQLVNCNEYKCNISRDTGYFINSESKDLINDNFIHCEKPLSYTYCKLASEKNGYFYNENNALKCIDSGCQDIVTSVSCEGRKDDIIYYSNYYNYASYSSYYTPDLAFCNDTNSNPILLSKSNGRIQYLLLPNINATSSSFPWIKKGNDTILLKVDNHSITQKLTRNSGICLSYQNDKMYINKGICDNDIAQCLCSQITDSCEVSIIGNLYRSITTTTTTNLYRPTTIEENNVPITATKENVATITSTNQNISSLTQNIDNMDKINTEIATTTATNTNQTPQNTSTSETSNSQSKYKKLKCMNILFYIILFFYTFYNFFK